MKYLVNRTIGISIEFDGDEFPSKTFFDESGFAETGNVVELLSVEPEEKVYFGIRYRQDTFKILDRRIITFLGTECLKDE